MKVLAIDPGNTMSAWCELVNGRPILAAKEANCTILQRIRAGCSWVSSDLCAIEMIASYGMAVGKEVFETCLWIGAFREALESRGAQVQLVYRRDVKLFLCHTARATDANIRAALLDHFGPGRELAVGVKRKPGPLYAIKGDMWAALAVAMTAAASQAPEAAGGLFAPPLHVEPQRRAGELADQPF